MSVLRHNEVRDLIIRKTSGTGGASPTFASTASRCGKTSWDACRRPAGSPPGDGSEPYLMWRAGAAATHMWARRAAPRSRERRRLSIGTWRPNWHPDERFALGVYVRGGGWSDGTVDFLKKMRVR